MSAIDKIRNGILTNNMIMVNHGFTDLTGENIEISKDDDNTQLQLMLSDIESIDEITRRMYDRLIKLLQVHNIVENDRPVDNNKSAPATAISDCDERIIDVPDYDSKTGHYGNKTNLITGEIAPGEAEENARRATKIHKQHRKSQINEANCTECGKAFQTSTPSSKDFGQKCNDCIISTHNSRD